MMNKFQIKIQINFQYGDGDFNVDEFSLEGNFKAMEFCQRRLRIRVFGEYDGKESFTNLEKVRQF